ncbi:MAG: YggS family pyridoxal phosphate-dependent enzyme [Proteobacteria bacterium]|nr:YggS family pyridoxal phosphate-dependent enzyme [Pseudomonadota bacterium]
MGPQNLPEQVAAIRARIAQAAQAAGRSAQQVTLLAVGKTQPAAALAAVAACGVHDFGESYLQEAQQKMPLLTQLPLTWHFIGRIQANKTRPIAAQFAWVHALDRLDIARRLSAQRPFHASPLNVCLQVRLGGEDSKGGVEQAALPGLAAAVAQLPRLKLRGLMALPPQESAPQRQRAWFAHLRQLQQQLNSTGLALDTLSMGMSEDFEAAILEGATIVRIGTALFGPRTVQ